MTLERVKTEDEFLKIGLDLTKVTAVSVVAPFLRHGAVSKCCKNATNENNHAQIFLYVLYPSIGQRQQVLKIERQAYVGTRLQIDNEKAEKQTKLRSGNFTSQ